MNGRLGFIEKYGQVHGTAKLGEKLGFSPEQQEEMHTLAEKCMKRFGVQVAAMAMQYAKDIGVDPKELFALTCATIAALIQTGELTLTEGK